VTRCADRDDAEYRVAAVAACLAQLRSGLAQARVDDLGGGPLRRLVGDQVGGDQPLEEPARTGRRRVECTELLE
jgi:hypothetical protein